MNWIWIVKNTKDIKNKERVNLVLKFEVLGFVSVWIYD